MFGLVSVTCLCALSWVVRWWSCLRRASSSLQIWSGRRCAALVCNKTYSKSFHVCMICTFTFCSVLLLWFLFTMCLSHSCTALLDWIVYERIGLPVQWCWYMPGYQGKCNYLCFCTVNVMEMCNHRYWLPLLFVPEKDWCSSCSWSSPKVVQNPLWVIKYQIIYKNRIHC